MEPITIGLWILGSLLRIGAGVHVWNELKDNLSSFVRDVRRHLFGAHVAP